MSKPFSDQTIRELLRRFNISNLALAHHIKMSVTKAIGIRKNKYKPSNDERLKITAYLKDLQKNNF